MIRNTIRRIRSIGYLYADTFAVGAELGGVHAIEGGDAV